MNLLQKFEQTQIEKHKVHTRIAEFNVGDTVIVNIKVVEGTRERIQLFKGVCISRKHAGINSAFTVRKISYDEGVESSFPIYSPRVESVEVVRHGAVRRSKLYYLRNLRGKAARINERSDYTAANETAPAKAKPAPATTTA